MPRYRVELNQMMKAFVEVDAPDEDAAMNRAEYEDNLVWSFEELHAVGAEEVPE